MFGAYDNQTQFKKGRCLSGIEDHGQNWAMKAIEFESRAQGFDTIKNCMTKS